MLEEPIGTGDAEEDALGVRVVRVRVRVRVKGGLISYLNHILYITTVQN